MDLTWIVISYKLTGIVISYKLTWIVISYKLTWIVISYKLLSNNIRNIRNNLFYGRVCKKLYEMTTHARFFKFHDYKNWI